MESVIELYDIKKLIIGSHELLEHVIKNRIMDLNKRNICLNMTPLILATLFCNFHIFEEVFNYDPTMINHCDIHKYTSILYSIIHGYRDKFDFLLKKGAKLTVLNVYDNKNALMIAAQQKDTYFLLKILDLNIFDIDAETTSGYTALIKAVCYSNLPAVKILLSYGANINHVSERWKSMDIIKCIMMCSNKDFDLLKFLIHNSANTYKALFYFSGNKTEKFGLNNVDILLKVGASPNQSNTHGITPLMNAVKKGNLSTVRLLVEYGADIYAKPRRGDSVIEIAEKLKSPDILHYLLKEDKWKRRRNFILFLRCFFRMTIIHNNSHSKIQNINNIFAFDKLNVFTRSIMSYI
jgi:ankyrin repeat protein